jgi:hypothetical protein
MTAALSGFRAYGLSIASEFEIPGGVRLKQPLTDADIVVAAGNTSIGKADAINGPYSRTGDALLFDAAGVARYYAPSFRQLFVEPYPDADPLDVAELLIATALPMLLWMRGGLVLHAAGIVPAGSQDAIAIAGPSGIGKSTLAVGLLKSGAHLVGDDSLWLTQRNQEPLVTGLSGAMFLSNGKSSPRSEMVISPASHVDQARLSAIITLKITDGQTQAVPRRLHGVDAVEALLRNRHRPKIPAILGQEAALLPQCILHCRTLPIYELTITNGDVARTQRHIAGVISDHLGSA